MKKIVLLFILAFIAGTLQAGNNGLAFLKIPTDARAVAMSGAYVALATDATASQWNPAGLAAAESKSLVLMHNAWLWDFKHNMAALQFTTGENNFAVSFNMLRVDDIEIRGEVPTVEPAAYSEAFTMAAAVSYARSFGSWQAGANLKYLFEQYFMESAPGWALDLGVRRENLFKNTTLAASVFNLGQMRPLAAEETPLPLLLRVGMAWVPDYSVLDKKLTIHPQFTWVNAEDSYGQLGLAYAVNGYITLRTGMSRSRDAQRWSAGLSLTYSSLSIDYAYTSHDFELGAGNTFSLRFYY